jgi:hypothetical protein
MSHDHQILHLLHRMDRKLDAILFYLDIVLVEDEAKSGTITFGGEAMDISVLLTDAPKTASAHEWSGLAGTGSELAPVGSITFASDTPSVVTVDPNTGVLGYISVGVANISFADSGNTITGTGAVTITASTPPPVLAQSGTVTFA